MAELKQTKRAARLLNEALACCRSYRHEFVMPEHLLLVMIDEECFNLVLNNFYDPIDLAEQIEVHLEDTESVPEEMEYEPQISVQLSDVITLALQHVAVSGAGAMDVPHLVKGILELSVLLL